MSSYGSASRTSSLIEALQVEDDIDFIGDDVFTTQIEDAKYEEVDINHYVAEYCTHLSYNGNNCFSSSSSTRNSLMVR